MIADGVLYTANCGDSEACLVSISYVQLVIVHPYGSDSGEISHLNLTVPHKASDPSEKERIESLGGHVFFGEA